MMVSQWADSVYDPSLLVAVNPSGVRTGLSMAIGSPFCRPLEDSCPYSCPSSVWQITTRERAVRAMATAGSGSLQRGPAGSVNPLASVSLVVGGTVDGAGGAAVDGVVGVGKALTGVVIVVVADGEGPGSRVGCDDPPRDEMASMISTGRLWQR